MTTRLVVSSCGCTFPCPLPEEAFERFGTGMDKGRNVRGLGSLVLCPACGRAAQVVRYRMVG